MTRARGIDRRIRRTRDQLHGALASLIHEKAYDDIVVKEILARADVGRSTFYAHFRDKDELLDSGLHDLLRAGRASSSTRSIDAVLAFSRPFFEHVERMRGETTVDPRRLTVVHERLRQLLAERIEADLRRASPHHADGCDLVARHVASTFLVVLDWWCTRDEPPAAARVEKIFRALVVPVLSEPMTYGAGV